MIPAARPQTIQIFLPLCDPRGIRIAEITTRIVQLIEVPRPQLDVFLAMPESEQVAVYFLFGQSDDGAEPKVYIGQTGDLRARLVSHNQKKDFWERALVLISRTNNLTQTHALFLEWYCLQAVRKAGRYTDENSNSGNKPHTPAPPAWHFPEPFSHPPCRARSPTLRCVHTSSRRESSAESDEPHPGRRTRETTRLPMSRFLFWRTRLPSDKGPSFFPRVDR